MTIGAVSTEMKLRHYQEDAKVCVFKEWETNVSTLVVLPTGVGKTVLFASIIKDSSLLSVIAINEFTLNAQEVNAFTFSTLESYLPLALGYLALTLPISVLSRSLERKFSYAT